MDENDNPETFNLDAWLEDAVRPQRSIRIYQRADVMADLDQLRQRIDLAEREAGDERSVGDTTLDALESEWAAKAAEFADSALDIRLQALNSKDIRSVEDEVFAGLPPKAKKDPSDEKSEELNLSLLARAIVDPPMSVAQVKKLTDRIGEPQVLKLIAAWRLAGVQDFDVSAPFSRASSTRGDGRTE